MSANMDGRAVPARDQAREDDGACGGQSGMEFESPAPGAIGTCRTRVGEVIPVLALEHDPTLPAGRVLIGVADGRVLSVPRRSVRLAATEHECLADIGPGHEETLDARNLPALRAATMNVSRDQDGRATGRIRHSTRLAAAQERGLPAWAVDAYGAWAGGTAHVSDGYLHIESEPVDLTGLDSAQAHMEITAADPGGDLRGARAAEALRYASTTTRESLEVSKEARAAAIVEAIVRHPARMSLEDVDERGEHAAVATVAATVQRAMPAIERAVRRHPEQTELREGLMGAVAWRHVGVQQSGSLPHDPQTWRPYLLGEFPEVVAAIDMDRVERTRAVTAIRFCTGPAAAHTRV